LWGWYFLVYFLSMKEKYIQVTIFNYNKKI
jgi:hypothetical protein